MVHEVKAKPDLMRALDPACIGIEGVGLVVAPLRVPPFSIAEGRIVRAEAKRRQAAFQGVGAVCPGNSQRVSSEVRAEVRGLYILAKSGPAERAVNQESGRHGVGLPDGRCLREGVALTDAPVA